MFIVNGVIGVVADAQLLEFIVAAEYAEDGPNVQQLGSLRR